MKSYRTPSLSASPTKKASRSTQKCSLFSRKPIRKFLPASSPRSVNYLPRVGGISRSLQIFRLSHGPMSECRGTELSRLLATFLYTVWLAPSRKKKHLFFSIWAIKSRRFMRLEQQNARGGFSPCRSFLTVLD